jgi:hypothetical protein
MLTSTFVLISVGHSNITSFIYLFVFLRFVALVIFLVISAPFAGANLTWIKIFCYNRGIKSFRVKKTTLYEFQKKVQARLLYLWKPPC